MASSSPAERPTVFPWPPVLFAGALVLAWAMGRVRPLPWPGLDDAPARAIGYGIGFGGVLLAGWALMTLAKARTNILPHRPADRLITTGPYRIWRHPIYMAEAMLLLGLAQASGNIWFAISAALFTGSALALAVLPEERHLEARFGAEFEAYRERTRRWF